MLLLLGHASTPDELEIISGTAADLDINGSYIDSNLTAPLAPESPTPFHGLMTTATTLAVLAAPTNASRVRNVVEMTIRNRDATDSTQVTIQRDVNSLGSDVVQIYSRLLAPGEGIEYIEGVGWFPMASSPAATVGTNKMLGSDQSLSTTDAYLQNSALPLAGVGVPTVGRIYRWRFILSKTAGTAAPVLTVRVGTAGTTSDTGRLTYTWGTGTSATDRCEIEIEAMFIAVGASAVLRGKANMTSNLTTTGFSNAVKALQPADSGTFDSTVANSLIGLSWNGSTAFAGALEHMVADTFQY